MGQTMGQTKHVFPTSHPSTSKNKAANILRTIRTFLKVFPHNLKCFSRNNHGPVPIQLAEDKPQPIHDLRIQIGDDEDIATRITLAIRQKMDDEGTDVELQLDVQAPASGNIAGRVDQATIFIQFLDLESDTIIDIKSCHIRGSQDATPLPARNPKAMVTPEPRQAVHVDFDQEVRWLIEVGRGMNRGHISHHSCHLRIGRHLPVKAYVRLSCICRKAKYVKPVGMRRLEIHLEDTGKH